MEEASTAMSDCGCDEYAYHSIRCPATPLYWEVLQSIAARPGYEDPYEQLDDPFSWGRWVCYYSGEPHWGGYVNGPTHYCRRIHTVVMEYV